MLHPALLAENELLAACEVRFARRSGPGGQHRNKTESAAIITYLPCGTSAEASERRSQADNRRVALFRLRLRLAVEVRSDFDSGSLPTLWRSRTAGGKVSVSSEHENFPAMLSIALDAIATTEWETTNAATHLGITTSQLIKLLRQYPAALMQVNQQRKLRNLHELR